MISFYELLGYIASGLIVLSLMMRSIVKLRTINLVGAATMSVYGLLIHAYPVAILNAIIVAIDIYYLLEMARPQDYFKLLEVRPGARYLHYFLEFYDAEIRKYNPDFVFRESSRQRIFFVLRNLIPAGLFITQSMPEGILGVNLDFVIPGYRDFKIGKFVYSKDSELFKEGVAKTIVTQSRSSKHVSYLKKMGFTPVKNDGNATVFQLHLD